LDALQEAPSFTETLSLSSMFLPTSISVNNQLIMYHHMSSVNHSLFTNTHTRSSATTEEPRDARLACEQTTKTQMLITVAYTNSNLANPTYPPNPNLIPALYLLSHLHSHPICLHFTKCIL